MLFNCDAEIDCFGAAMNFPAEVSCVDDLIIDKKYLKVAFASLDGDCVDQHFGSSQGFYVYGVSASEAMLLSSKSFPKELKDGNEDKLKPKLAWLVGADMVYCGSIGGSATKQLIALGVHPKVVKEGPDIDELLDELHSDLSGDIPPALERIIKNKQPKTADRFAEMDDEGWSE